MEDAAAPDDIQNDSGKKPDALPRQFWYHGPHRRPGVLSEGDFPRGKERPARKNPECPREGKEEEMKKRLSIFLMFILSVPVWAAAVSAGAGQGDFTKEEIETMSETKAVLETPMGEITLAFFPDVAPGHVKNFIDLAKKGFYDGTTFHRVIPDFMIQGGDPNSKSPDRSRHGMGGPGYALKAEFNAKPHRRGTLSMARSMNPDSAGSQFFICVTDCPFLNRQYTVFGEVVSGMDAVDKIVSQPRDARDNPLDRIEMKIRIIEPEGK